MKNHRIPTILGTLLLLVVLATGVWLSLQTTNTQSGASGDCSPSGIQVTNLTNKSADISFTTSATCASSLNVDSQTIQNFKSSSTTHYFRVNNLSASTQYQYFIISNGQEHRQVSYVFKTAPLPSGSLPTANLAWGKVVLASGSPSPNSIVYLNISGALPLSALTDSNGQWHILLSNSFTEDKTSLFTPPTTGVEDIYVYSPDGQLTQLENNIASNDPVPNIIVGQGQSNLGQGPISTQVPAKAVATSTPIIISTKLKISSPAEGESITALKPDIFGTGKGNSTVNLGVDTATTGTTVSKTDGTWNWSPTANLSLGKHILTVTLGNEILQRNFTIITPSSSTSPLSFSSTPSATVAPVLTSTPTSMPTTIPTIRTSKPSTKSGVPVTGTTSPLYFLLLSSLLAGSFSLYFFYKDEK